MAQQALVATPGNEEIHAGMRWLWEDLYLDASRNGDVVESKAYTSQVVDESGVVPYPKSPESTLNGWAYRPDALGTAVRHAHKVTGGVPILLTENTSLPLPTTNGGSTTPRKHSDI